MIVRGTLFKYVKPGMTFIETGTREGNTVAMALELGAVKVITTENQRPRYEAACQRFKGDTRVELHHGESYKVLDEVILPKLETSAVFWLDAHTTGKLSPIIYELNAIQRATHKNPKRIHTLLIDDVRCYKRSEWQVSLGELMDAITAINPRYTLYMEDGYEPWDILVARP